MQVEWHFSDGRVLHFGERLYLAGSPASLGSWGRFIPMEWRRGVGWVKVSLPLKECCEYKFVVSEYETTINWIRWDEGENRKITPFLS